MENGKVRRTHFAASFLFFGLTSIIALFLLVLALVVWLTQVTGSLIAASLIVGGTCALLALTAYLLSVRERLEELREHFETMYEVARIARTGYEWVTQKLCLFLNLSGK